MAEVLAIIGFAEQCLKYGDKFIRRCRSYLHAEEEAKELLIAIESNWVKVETQIKILQRIGRSLNRSLQASQAHVLSLLEGKLKTATLDIDQLLAEKKEQKEAWKRSDHDLAAMVKGLADMRASKKMRYVCKKKRLYEILDEIEKWQARFDPTWILIMQMSIGNIDEELDEQDKKLESYQIPIIAAAKGVRDAVRATQDEKGGGHKSVWIENDDIDLDPSWIPNSSVKIATLEDEKRQVIVDTMICNPAANPSRTMKEVRNMALILTQVDPSTFGLLKCRGVIKVPKASLFSSPPPLDFKFIFEVPRHLTNPQSLRAILLSETSYPLNERLELAKKLTSSILFVHTVQFVHKNIRPETIIVFENEFSAIGAPFLAGFEQFRLEDGITHRAGDEMWERNLYRHPSRQGTHPEMDYQMQHDIYSLGVVLLEIGLWTSFLIYDLEKDSALEPNCLLSGAKAALSRSRTSGALENKQKLEDLAASELPARLGKRYTDIVLLCLRCLDAGSDNGEDEKGFGVDIIDWKDEDGVVIGVRYIENVLQKIQEITI